MIQLNQIESFKHTCTVDGELIAGIVASTLPHSNVTHDFVNPYHNSINKIK